VTLRLLAALLAALALAGCGLGPGKARPGGTGVELRVTRDFGQRLLAGERRPQVRQGESVLGLLKSRRRVETAYGGGFVQSIDGLEGEGRDGGRDWFYFVNGIEAEVGADRTTVSPGDVVQWDYRDYGATMSVPAIVGAFPNPFVRGTEGKRFPVRVECEQADAPACDEVLSRLRALGVPASPAVLGSPGTANIVRVLVSRWARISRTSGAEALTKGPEESGVFARFEGPDGPLLLLDENGRTARPAEPGTGLVAATAQREQEQLVWLVTGLDRAGVDRAARSLDARTLRDAFAVAAAPGGAERLPVQGRG
jgi:hypothetical protein